MNAEPHFLTIGDVLTIHEDQLSRYGGEVGGPSFDLLRAAVGAPSATFGGRFLYKTLFEVGAAYLYHITQNHPFVDGNKRVGIVAALVFFALNDIHLKVNEDELVDLSMGVAQGRLSQSEVTVFFQQHAVPG
ncbi:MAG: type II toxin-antitoxin system death-on-curing family toxin [Nitrospiraceae bacterium]|nr:type II toxin-antitoxin system death-on-curing family toxin [Nitrospiraceae bacterium]